MIQHGSGSGNGAWRNYVIAVLTTALITITTGWVTRDTVQSDDLTPLQTSVKELTASVNELKVEVAVLNQRIKDK